MTTLHLSIRALTSDDDGALAEFPCAGFREPWTVEVEEAIQQKLADALATGDVHAVGAWDGDVLCGVSAWRVRGDRWESAIVAVRIGYRGRKIGGLLKDDLLERARAGGRGGGCL